jgi:tRNA(fMet)-specific endonuclease VapC
MDKVLLDTTVLSFLFREDEVDPRRTWYQEQITEKVAVISFQSLAELWPWAEENDWGPQRREKLERFVRKFLIIPYEYDLARSWARIGAQAKRQGRRLEAGDTWIIASAVYWKVPLLSHDRDMIGLKIPGLNVISALDQ